MCDHAAGEITQGPPADRPVNLLYHTKTDLIINDEYITSNMKQNIRIAFGTGPMREYLQEKWKWTDATIEDIDWEAHGRALQRLPNSSRIATTKMIHRWLPTSSRQHELSNGKHPASCPICNHEKEDQQHFLSCSHEKYNDVSKKFLRRIDSYCDTYTCPLDLARLLQLAIQHWPTPPIHLEDFPESLHPLINKQQAIGWNQVYYGRFTIEWTRQFNRYAMLEQRTKNGGKWITGITEIIFQHLHVRWKHRSSIAHDNSDKTKPTQAMEAIDNHIKELYSRRREIFSHRQQSFNIPLEQLLKRPTSTKRTWIGLHEKHIKQLIIQKLDHTLRELFEYKQHLPTTYHHLFQPPLEKLLRKAPLTKRIWLQQRESLIKGKAQEFNILTQTITPSQASDSDEISENSISPSHNTPSSSSASITSLVSNIYSSTQKLLTRFQESEKNTTD